MRGGLAAAVLTVLLLLPGGAGRPAAAAPSRTLELRAAAVVVREGVIEARGDVRVTDGRSRLRAGWARYLVRERRLELRDGVVLETPQGDLRAGRALAQLSPDRRLASVEASVGVVLRMGARRLEAGRVTYTPDVPTATASGGVRLHLPPDIRASGRELVLRGSVARLAGGARVETRDGAIEGDTIEVSEAEQAAFVRGNVRAAFADTRITSATAALYSRERRAVFREDVTVVRPGRTLRAALVTVFYAEGRVVAEGETTIRIDQEEPGP